MNERIRALMEQSFVNGPIGADGYPEYSSLDGQTLAELIIKECIEICTSGDIEKPMGNYYAKQIQKRFGIKV